MRRWALAAALLLTPLQAGALDRGQRGAIFSPRSSRADPGVGRIAFGVCHRATPSYPSGVFWFAVAY